MRFLWKADHRFRQSGFTLGELVIVMTIMGILAGVAAPRFANSMAFHRVDGAARRIVLDFQTARRRAIMTSASQVVRFNIGGGSYELPGGRDLNDPTANTYIVNLSEPPYGADIVAADFGGDVEIVFDGWGKPDSGGTVLVAVGSHEKTIDVDPDTGQASIR